MIKHETDQLKSHIAYYAQRTWQSLKQASIGRKLLKHISMIRNKN